NGCSARARWRARRCGARSTAASASCWPWTPAARRTWKPRWKATACRTGASARSSPPLAATACASADGLPMASASGREGRFRIAALASGRGSNLQALIDAMAAGTLDAELVGVFSDRADAQALDRARMAGAQAVALNPRDFPNRLEYDAALFERVDAVRPDLVVCAGYMRLISAPAVDARAGLLVNIHPSLLPQFKGLHTHR